MTPLSKKAFDLNALEGTAKKFVRTATKRSLQSRRKRALAVVQSAIAAQLLDGSRTAHSTVNIPIPVTSEIVCSIQADSQLGHELCETHLIIWDELVTTHRQNLDKVDRPLRDIPHST